MIQRPIRRLLTAGLWALLLAYAFMVVHDFYTYVDRAIYVSVDDAEAAIAYALATTGRYSFLPSPVLFGMSRLHGQFNYGPWYFSAAAAAIRLFGYSLTLVRSLHLWVMLGCVASATIWFRGRDRSAAPVLFGFGLLYFFDVLEWPMVRPDSFVSAFAVVLVISVGLAWQRGHARYWFLAGLAAACGAFTHLIAAALVPSVIVLFAVAALYRRMEISRAAIALGAGLLAGIAMFYASFGFDFAAQWRFLHGYRDLTASADTYIVAMQRHFRSAFVGTPQWLQMSVWISLGVAWLAILNAVIRRSQTHDRVMAYVLPPAVVWTFYLLSIGKYTNYHAGYGILHHVMFLWIVSALLWTWLEWMSRSRPFTATVMGSLATCLMLGQGVRQLEWLSANPGFASRSEHHVAFTEYADRVLGALPARSHAWGTVFFGIESPDRIQIVQYDDAAVMLLPLTAADRAAVAPEYLVWGYPEVRDETLAVLSGTSDTRIASVQQLLPDMHYRLAALVDGAPYGVTRVYARASVAGGGSTVPSVAMYDEVHHEWLERTAAPLTTMFAPLAPVPLHIGYEAAPVARVPTSTVAADLPPGRYLLKVAIRSGTGRAQRLIAVTPWTMTTQTVQDLGLRPRGDFAAYLPGDRDVYAVSTHPGGLLYVSQFDGSGGAAIESVTASPVTGIADADGVASDSRPLPDFTRWIPQPGVRMLLTPTRSHVDGDVSLGGYQLYSPVIKATPGERVEVDAPSRIARGQVCVGILNAAGRWLVSAMEWRQQLDFRADATGGFRVAFANCQSGVDLAASAFDVSEGRYVRHRLAPYSERFFDAAFERRLLTGAYADEPPSPRFPDQPRIQLLSSSANVRAATSGDMLFRARPRYVDTETRLLVSGRLDRGVLAVGLQKDGVWATRVDVTDTGAFTVLLAPASNGAYSPAVAAATPGGDVVASLTRVDLLPAIRPAK